MNLKNQRRVAAEILDIGKNRVWFDPDSLDRVDESLTREDLKGCIKDGIIRKRPEKGNSRGRLRHIKSQKKKGLRRGSGHRRGTANARASRKRSWISRIRALRGELTKMKEEREIDRSMYRKLYRQSKGNLFHSRRHLREHVERMKSY